MPEFSAAPDGAKLELDEIETRILKQLTDEMRAVLGGKHSDRGDPVYDRLFPSVYERAEDEAAYRDLTGTDLEEHKRKALDVVSGHLGRRRTDATITGEDFEAWIAALTDMRLAIGTRLDVDE